MVTLCAAMDVNNVIGDEDAPYGMPWDCLTDRMLFRRHTWGADCIVGRKTWESLPRNVKECPGRRFWMLTSSINGRASYKVTNSENPHRLKSSWESMISVIETRLENRSNHYVIVGGASIYKQAIEEDIVDRLFITRFHFETGGDIYFPDFLHKFKVVKRDIITTSCKWKQKGIENWEKNKKEEVALEEYIRR